MAGVRRAWLYARKNRVGKGRDRGVAREVSAAYREAVFVFLDGVAPCHSGDCGNGGYTDLFAGALGGGADDLAAERGCGAADPAAASVSASVLHHSPGFPVSAGAGANSADAERVCGDGVPVGIPPGVQKSCKVFKRCSLGPDFARKVPIFESFHRKGLHSIEVFSGMGSKVLRTLTMSASCVTRGLGQRLGTNRRLRGHLKDVAELDLALVDTAGGELEDALHVPVDGGEAIGDEALPELDDAVVLVKSDDIDGELHADGMDAGGGLDPEPSSGVDSILAEETDHSGKGGARDVDVIPDQRSASLVNDGDDLHTDGSPAGWLVEPG